MTQSEFAKIVLKLSSIAEDIDGVRTIRADINELIKISSDAAGVQVTKRNVQDACRAAEVKLYAKINPKMKSQETLARTVAVAKVVREVCVSLRDDLGMDLSEEIRELTQVISRYKVADE